ncbi:MAG: phosphoglucosamine mutase [Fimbriimonadaceae bacterium]
MKFGTDGVRGVANADLTPELALALGISAGRWLAETDLPRRVVVGRDTRRSGPMLDAALGAGFGAAGIDVVQLGVAPTPAVAFVTRAHGFGMGAVVSASHNPAPDNGIKLFAGNGAKLPADAEAAIEVGLFAPFASRPVGVDLGRIEPDGAGVNNYLDFLVDLVPEGLVGLNVAMDCANGAAYRLGPEILKRLGADVVAINADPDGDNINVACGATHPEAICEFTKSAAFHAGVAFDGDADRVIFADQDGMLINGDRTIGIWAAYHQAAGELTPASVVGTVMSNGGFEAYLSARGIKLLRTPVGDKYVSRELAATGSLVGGEQSGHIVFPKHAPSGDGLITMLELFRVVRLSGKALREWGAEYASWPQLLINVSIAEPKAWDSNARVRQAVSQAATALGRRGRVNVRPSGTQPIVRVMVEADSYELRDAAAAQILGAMQAELDATVYSKVDLTNALGD